METVITEATHLQRKDERISIIIQSPELPKVYVRKTNKISLLKKLLKFSDDQQPNNFVWVSISLFVHGCVLAPITMLCILYAGNYVALWIPCIFGFAITEITNLAGLPTRITIPVFLASILIDIILIIISLSLYLN